MLYDINPYVQVFQQTGRLLQQNSQNLTMIITDSRMTDSQCYNVPTTSEIAAIIVGDNNNPSNVSNCDIILHSHEGGLHCISELRVHRAYMHYCIMFFFFQEGKMDGIQQFQSEMRHNHIFLILKSNMKLMKTALNLKDM